MKAKHYLTTMTFLLMALVMAAQPVNNIVENLSQSKQESYVQIGKNIYRDHQMTAHQKQSLKDTGEPKDSANVLIRFLKKTEQTQYGDFTFYNADFAENYYIQGEEREIKIPIGLYDIFSKAYEIDYENPDLFRYLFHIKELVSIASDTTIIIDFSECVNEWVDEIEMANGELMTRTIIRQLDHEPWQETVLEGNILWETGDRMMRNEEYDITHHCVTSHGSLTCDYNKSSLYNDISDRYTFIQNFVTACNDGNLYTSYVSGKGFNCMPLKITKDEYVLYEETICNTPQSANVNDWPVYTTWWLSGATSDRTVANIKKTIYKDNLYYSELEIGNMCWMPSGENGVIRTYLYSPTVEIPDYALEIKILDLIDTSSGWNEFITNITPKFKLMKNGESLYLVDGGSSVKTEKSDPFEYRPDYPAHPKFSYTTSQKTDNFFNNCPINAIISQGKINKWQNVKQILISNCPCGRYGEMIGSDNYYSTLSVKYNDENIYNGALSTWWPEMREDGVYELTITNSNVLVDDIPGNNVTTVYFDQNLEDWNFPVMKMLQFRDCDNNVTDRFEVPNDGIIMFAGGDFDPRSKTYIDDNGYENTWEYEVCQPMTIEVSYAPYGSKDWQPLDGIEHQSEFDDIPGMGFFYSGSLASVNVPSENKWYDLKFHLVDESGNWQEQIISPAFKIESLTPDAITEVINGDASEVARYTVDGCRISSPQPGINIVVMSDGTAHKVLVK